MMNSFSVIFSSFLSIVLLDIIFLVAVFFGGGVWFSIESEFWTHFPLFFFLKGEESSHCIIHSICCRNCPQNHCQAGQLFHHSELPTSRVHYVLSVLWHRRQTKFPQETSRKDREPMLDIGSNSFPSQEKLGIGFSTAFHTELWKGIWQVSAPKLCSPQSPIWYSLLSVLKLRK